MLKKATEIQSLFGCDKALRETKSNKTVLCFGYNPFAFRGSRFESENPYENSDSSYILSPAYLRADDLCRAPCTRLCETRAPGNSNDLAVRAITAARGNDGWGTNHPRAGHCPRQ